MTANWVAVSATLMSARGPNRVLDEALGKLFKQPPLLSVNSGEPPRWPAYTGSIDEALKLSKIANPNLRTCGALDTAKGWAWHLALVEPGVPGDMPVFVAESPTAPLAILVAAMKSLIPPSGGAN